MYVFRVILHICPQRLLNQLLCIYGNVIKFDYICSLLMKGLSRLRAENVHCASPDVKELYSIE